MDYQDLNKTKPAPGTLCSVADEQGNKKIFMWLMQRWWEYAYEEETNTSSFVLIKDQERYTKWMASSENAVEVPGPTPTDSFASLAERIENLENAVKRLCKIINLNN